MAEYRRDTTKGMKTVSNQLETINKLLDEAKTVTGSDRQTALRMGYLNGSFVARMRSGDRPVPVETATRIAQIIGRPPFQVICEIEGAQARTEESRKYWASLRRNAAAAAVAFVVMGTTSKMLGGGSCWDRTSDQRIKSPMLYRLS